MLKILVLTTLLSHLVFAEEDGAKKQCDFYENGKISFIKANIDKFPGEKLHLAIPYNEADCSFKKTDYISSFWKVYTEEAFQREGYHCKNPARIYWKKVRPQSVNFINKKHYKIQMSIIKGFSKPFGLNINKTFDVTISKDLNGSCKTELQFIVNDKQIIVEELSLGVKVKLLSASSTFIELIGTDKSDQSNFNFYSDEKVQ